MAEEAKWYVVHTYSGYENAVGNGTAVASARNYAKEIVRRLLDAGVNAVILTST